MIKANKTIIKVIITKENEKILKQLAENENRSLSSYVNNLIDRHIKASLQ